MPCPMVFGQLWVSRCPGQVVNATVDCDTLATLTSETPCPLVVRQFARDILATLGSEMP